MSTLLLDTNIVSFIFKRDSRATAYAPLLQGNRLAISFMTAAELFQWAIVRNWGQARVARLEQSIATYLIIPPDLDLCRAWGKLRGLFGNCRGKHTFSSPVLSRYKAMCQKQIRADSAEKQGELFQVFLMR